MTTKIVEQMYQDASPPEETIEPDNRIEELEKQISELRYLMARYQEALYETKKNAPLLRRAAHLARTFASLRT